jgi:hypothetical protein
VYDLSIFVVYIFNYSYNERDLNEITNNKEVHVQNVKNTLCFGFHEK